MILKRLMDLVLVVLLLPVWIPLFVLVYLFVLAKAGNPVFFRQTRAGLQGKPFQIIKFRTMSDLRDASGNLLPDEDRLPRWGRCLRSLSLDELPEILNVLRGEMSLVGPRPLPVIYLGRYSPEQARRHDCLPGITGWAQINGRNAVDWERRFALDVWYVDHRNLGLDLKILLLTLFTVLRREGISAENTATMHEFMGSGTARSDAPARGEVPPHSPDPSRKSE